MAPFLKLTYTVDKIILCIIFNGLKKNICPRQLFRMTWISLDYNYTLY